MPTVRLAATSKTRLDVVPLTEMVLAPGPLMVTLSVMDSSPLVRGMVPARPRQYPQAVVPPDGLSASNVFLVQNGEVTPLVSPADLKNFFFNELSPVLDDDAAADAGRAWLRLTETFSQDGFYTFSAPEVNVVATPNGEFIVTGSVTVTAGGRGSIKAELVFDAFDGSLEDVSETRDVHPGVRPL
jgi:hypothetical protein